MKQDYERCILYYNHSGKVLRFNHYVFLSKYNPTGGEGGVGHRDATADAEHTRTFERKYGAYIRNTKTHRDGSSSFVLKSNAERQRLAAQAPKDYVRPRLRRMEGGKEQQMEGGKEQQLVFLLAEAQHKLRRTPSDVNLQAEVDSYTRELTHLEQRPRPQRPDLVIPDVESQVPVESSSGLSSRENRERKYHMWQLKLQRVRKDKQAQVKPKSKSRQFSEEVEQLVSCSGSVCEGVKRRRR